MADLLPSIPDASAPEDAEPRVVCLGDEAAEDVLGALSSTTARELFAAINDDPAHPAALANRVDTSLQNVQYHLGKLADAGMVEVVDTAYSEKGREMDVYAPADSPLVLFAGDQEDQTLLDRALGRLLGGVGMLAGASLALRGVVNAGESPTAPETTEYSSRTTGGAPGSNTSDDGATAGDAETDDSATDSGGDAAMEDGDSMDGGDGATDTGAETTDGADGGDGGGSEVDLSADLQSGDGVEPLAQDATWLADALDATALPPELFVFLVGGCLLAVGTGTWYWRKRQTRV